MQNDPKTRMKSINWKEFLKPTIGKIILSLVLLIAPIIDFFLENISIFTKITNALFFPATIFYIGGFEMNKKDNSCKFCNFCNSCYSCKNLVNGFMCINLKLEKKDTSKYWIFNKEVTKEEWDKRFNLGKALK